MEKRTVVVLLGGAMALALGGAALAGDFDADGLGNAAEISGISSPYRSDSDGDGLCDGGHGAACRDPVTGAARGRGEADFSGSPADNDTDGDTISDAEEARSMVVAGYHAPTSALRSFDTDQDGLTDAEERRLGTNRFSSDSDGDGVADRDELGQPYFKSDPLRADTDGDSLQDGEEVRLGLDPTRPDPDGDGLTDAQEVNLGTNAWSEDSDYDQMPDGWEVRFSLNPLENDADDDADYDIADGKFGLTNVQEWYEGTNPQMRDTDGDEMPDLWEVIHGTNATIRDDLADLDSDGLPNVVEFAFGTKPLEPDSDTDELLDGEEIRILLGVPIVISDPNAHDTALDIASDRIELRYWQSKLGLSTLDAASSEELRWIADRMHTNDSDGDGLIDGDEMWAYALDADSPDSDNDGIPDAEEILVCWSDPHTAGTCTRLSSSDSDADGVNDAIERAFWGSFRLTLDLDGDGLLPLADDDTDGDGIGDAEEIGALGLLWSDFYHGSPASDDTDNDGLRDSEEASNGLTSRLAQCDTSFVPGDGWRQVWSREPVSGCWYVTGAWGIKLYAAPGEG